MMKSCCFAMPEQSSVALCVVGVEAHCKKVQIFEMVLTDILTCSIILFPMVNVKSRLDIQ